MSKMSQLAAAFEQWWFSTQIDDSIYWKETAGRAFTEGYALRANEDAVIIDKMNRQCMDGIRIHSQLSQEKTKLLKINAEQAATIRQHLLVGDNTKESKHTAWCRWATSTAKAIFAQDAFGAGFDAGVSHANQKPATAKETGKDGVLEAAREIVRRIQCATGDWEDQTENIKFMVNLLSQHCVGKELYAVTEQRVGDAISRAYRADEVADTEKARADNLQAEMEAMRERHDKELDEDRLIRAIQEGNIINARQTNVILSLSKEIGKLRTELQRHTVKDSFESQSSPWDW